VAIDSANNSPLFAALLNEKYAQFWKLLSSVKNEKSFLKSAAQLYSQWGSEIKVKQIEKLIGETILTKKESFSSLRKSTSKKYKTANIGVESVLPSLPETSDSSDTHFPSPSRKMADIDIDTVIKVTNSITNETDLKILVDTIVGHLMSNTGATRVVLFVNEEDGLKIQRIFDTSEVDHTNLEMAAPYALTNYVYRTKESKVYSETPTEGYLVADKYFETYKPRSILCCPIKHQNVLTGVIYLENRIQNGIFTASRVKLVQTLMASASISIANANLLQKNKELSLALGNSISPSPNFNVETPIQKVFDAIKQVKERFEPNDPIIHTLDVVLSTLTSDGLFRANLGEINGKDGKGIDLDTKNWIENSLLMTGNTTDDTKNVSSVDLMVVKETSANHRELLLNSMQPVKKVEINRELEVSGLSTFNCFKLAELTNGTPLYFLTYHMLEKYKLIEAFNLNPVQTHNFLQKVESGYNRLPFHNR
jgi:hypothetical protein